MRQLHYLPFEESGEWKTFDVHLKNGNILLSAYGADIDEQQNTVVQLHLDLPVKVFEELWEREEYDCELFLLRQFLQDSSSEENIDFVIPVSEIDEDSLPVILSVFWDTDDNGYSPEQYFPIEKKKYQELEAESVSAISDFLTETSEYCLDGYFVLRPLHQNLSSNSW